MIGVGGVMLPSMVMFGLVAAADMTTRRAHPQVNPGGADPQAVLTPIRVRLDVGNLRWDVGTFVSHARNSSHLT